MGQEHFPFGQERDPAEPQDELLEERMEPEQPMGQLVQLQMPWFKCLDCIGMFIQFHAEQLAGQHPEDEEPPAINDAITLAPSWQMRTVGGQTVMACVAVPACMDHLQAKPTTALEKAVLGGKILPATAN